MAQITRHGSEGAGSPEVASRGGVALELAGLCEIDTPRVVSTGIQARRDLYSMRDPPVRLGWGNGARHGVRGSRGGFARWRLPVCGVPAAGVCYGPQLLAQKREDDGTVLTEGLSRLELQCRGVDGDVPRWRRDEAGGPGGAELFRTPGSLGPTRGTPVKPAQGSA